MASAQLLVQGINRRRSILRFIRKFNRDYGCSPSLMEIAEHEGVNKTAARRHVQILVDEGVLEMAPGRHRSLRVLGTTTPPARRK